MVAAYTDPFTGELVDPTTSTLDLERLVDVLGRTDTMTNVDVAHEVGDIGVPVLPTIPGGKDPLLTRLHIDGTTTDKATGEIVRIAPPCLACKQAGFAPAKDHGATVDPDTIRRYWKAHPDAGVGMKNHPRLVRGDGDFADGAELIKARKRIGYGQPDGVPEPFSAYTPGGQYRRRFIHWLPDGVNAPGGGTKVLGVSWYGAAGYTLVKGGHPSGRDYMPFTGAEITPLPPMVAANIKRDHSGDSAEDAANDDEVTAFLNTHDGTERLELLARRRKALATTGEGFRHETAVGMLYGCFREAVAGYFPARVAHDAIRDGLKAADGRLGAEWASMVAWAVGQVDGLDPDSVRAELASEESKRTAKHYEHGYEPAYVDSIDVEAPRDLTIAEIDARLADIERKIHRDDEPPSDAGWQVTDLDPAWNGDKPQPAAMVLERSDGVRLFLPGINYAFGDSGDGKSWIAAFAARQALRRGEHVVWVTYEDPNELEVVLRIKLLGVTVEEKDRLHHVTATEALTGGVDFLARLVRSTGATLLVLDSTGEANAVEGVDEDRDADWGPWARRTLRRLIDICSDPDWAGRDHTAPNDRLAVLPIDHSTKAKDNAFYPSGTKRKRAAITGLMVLVAVRQPFAKDRVGRVQLVCAKDRSGRFRRGEIVAEIKMDATTEPYAIYVDPPAAGAEMTSGQRRKTDERVLQVLAGSAVSLDSAAVHRLVNDDEYRLPGEGEVALGTIRNTLTKLAERPNITVEDEPTGRGKSFTRRYGVGTGRDLDEEGVA